MRAYISGPMTGRPKFNFPLFGEVAEFLRDAGWTVTSPAEHDEGLYDCSGPDFDAGDVGAWSARVGFDYQKALAWDLEQVVKADAIVMLPGWELSTGARHERYAAEVTGRRIYLAVPGNDGDWWIADDQSCKVSEAVAAAAKPAEVRVVDSRTGGAKGSKRARYDLIPARPLHVLAEHYGIGAEKYEPRNWERGYSWSLNFAALQRHVWAWWAGEDLDPETSSPHLAAVAWHAFALLEFAATRPELDDRPRPLDTAACTRTLPHTEAA